MNSTHKQSTQLREYYFRAFFNCSRMSRPRVINFNPDAPIECREAAPPKPVPSQVSTKVPAVHETYVAGARLVPPQDLSHKPWKNIAITEYDDAEFQELQARLVFTWPPDLVAYRREVEQRSSGEATERADENIVPAAFYGTSPTGSASTEDSSMILTPTQQNYDTQTVCGALAILHEALAEPEAKAGALEKVVGLQRLRRKAPPPLSLNNRKKQDVISEIGCTLLIGNGERTAREIRQMLSPLTAAMNLTSKLSAGVLRNIHTFSDELLF